MTSNKIKGGIEASLFEGYACMSMIIYLNFPQPAVITDFKLLVFSKFIF